MTFNPHQWYLQGLGLGVSNTFIGGVSATINTPELLATTIGTTVANIKNFKIVGENIECIILNTYSIKASAFRYNTDLTYYRDLEGKIINISSYGFGECEKLSLVELPEILSITGGYVFRNETSITHGLSVITPKLTNLGNSVFYGCNRYIVSLYAPLLVTAGLTTLVDQTFYTIHLSSVLYVNPSLATSNGGAEEGDVAYVRGRNNNSIRYVTNFSIPNQITDLSVQTVFATEIRLSFTAPTGTNAIDYYDVFVDGVYNNRGNYDGVFAVRLQPNTTYNIKVVPVDMFFNKSTSNEITVQTNTTYSSVAPVLSLTQFRGIQAYLGYTKPAGAYAFSKFNIYVDGLLYISLTALNYSMINRFQGISYAITVTQVDIYGIESPVSNTLNYLNDGSLIPATVTNFTLEPRGIEAYMTYSTPSVGFNVWYNLYRNGALIVSMTTATILRQKPIPFNISYDYQIRSSDQYGNINPVLSAPITYINNQQYKPEQITAITVVETFNTAVRMAITIPAAMFQIESYTVNISGVLQSSASNTFIVFGLVHNVATDITVTCVDIYGNISDISPVFSITASGTGTGYTQLFNAYFKFDGDLVDTMGLISATASGTPVYETAKVGQGVKGITSATNAINTNQNTLIGGRKEFTISGIYKTNLLKNSNVLFAQWSNAPFEILLRGNISGGLQLYLTTDKGLINGVLIGTTNETINFHHLVITYDGVNVKCYLNKILQNTTVITGTVVLNNTKKEYFLGGYDTPSFGNYTIDEFVFWKQAINQTVVNDIYDKQMNGISLI